MTPDDRAEGMRKTLEEMIAAVKSIPPDPLNGARAIVLHPDRVADLRSLSSLSPSTWLAAGLEVRESVFALKDRGVLEDVNRRIVGVVRCPTSDVSTWTVYLTHQQNEG